MGSLKETRRQQKFQVGQWLPRKSSATKVGQFICGPLPGRQFICRQWKSLNGPLQPQLCHIQTFLSFWRVQLRPFMEAHTCTRLVLQAHHNYEQQAQQFNRLCFVGKVTLWLSHQWLAVPCIIVYVINWIKNVFSESWGYIPYTWLRLYDGQNGDMLVCNIASVFKRNLKDCWWFL